MTVALTPLGRWLASRRETPSWLARQLGVSRQAVSAWLCETRPVPPERAEQISALSGGELSLVDLLTPGRAELQRLRASAQQDA